MIKVLKITGTIGKCVSLIILLFAISTLCVSIKLSYENKANPFCLNKYKNEIIKLEYDEIETYSYHFECSTLYVELNLSKVLKKSEVVSLLMSISNDLEGYECFTHFEINNKNEDKTLYASINLQTKEISLIG